MINLIDYILDLFRDENHAQAFVANPDQALADAGLSTVSSAQLQSVAATAIPSLALGGSGDAVTDLQQAVSSYYGFEPSYASQPDFSPSTDLASNNSFMSPTTNITDDHSVSFGMGDITLGDKTTAQGDGAVAVGGSTHGDIVSGDGAVLGNGNTVNNGDIHTGSGSTVTVGDGNAISEGNTSAGGDLLSSHDGTVSQTSGHGTTTVSDGNTTSVHGNQTITDIHGTGNTSAVDNSSTLTHTSTIDNSEHDSSVHSSSIVDTSVHDNSVHDSSVHDTSLHDNSIHETTHTDTGLDAHLGF
ncbi:MAG: hypothetical protein QOJ20_3339 [Mycobacterium sp.]|jgi:hypothetical protein|nr:hypothetical protein [Mycobacterium sp.]